MMNSFEYAGGNELDATESLRVSLRREIVPKDACRARATIKLKRMKLMPIMKPRPHEPATESPTLTSASFEDLVREMLVRLGEDPNAKASPPRPNASTRP